VEVIVQERISHPTIARLAVYTFITVLVAGCAAGPRQRPIPTQRIDTVEGSLQSVRRQFAGTWDLVTYETFDAPGQAVLVPATGQILCDEFGNIEFVGEIDRTAEAGIVETLNGAGRLAIDVQMQRFMILDLEGNLNLGQNEFAAAPADRFRYYEFDGDELLLTIKDESDRTTARVTYRRR
jgi:hypothetical protein